MKTLIKCSALMSGLLTGPMAHAIPVTIDFELDAVGARANGFVSATVPGVSFFDTVGGELGIYQVPEGSGLRSLVVGTDLDGSALEIRFDSHTDFLSLAFGNDDPLKTNAGDLALLTIFSGATQLGQVAQVLNRDDLMNQSIQFGAIDGAVLFDRAVFAFTNPTFSTFTGGGSFADVGATEVVDNIVFNSRTPVLYVSEPSAVSLLTFALPMMLFTGGRRRARKLGWRYAGCPTS